MCVYISIYVYFMLTYETVKTVPLKMYMSVQGSTKFPYFFPRIFFECKRIICYKFATCKVKTVTTKNPLKLITWEVEAVKELVTLSSRPSLKPV